MTNWIDCKESLPEIRKSVLACSHNNSINDSIYVAWIESFGIENRPIWQYSWCCGCFCGEDITHWAELPEAPQKSFIPATDNEIEKCTNKVMNKYSDAINNLKDK